MTLPRNVALWWPHFDEAGKYFMLDPFLLAAICARESGGGVYLVPRGPEGTGDGGHGRGLMQIDDRYHGEFIARKLPDGRFAWQDARENIRYGAGLLRQYLDQLDGDMPAAIAAYNAGPTRIGRVKRRLSIDAPLDIRLTAYDACTTGRDYARDVLRRRDEFSRPLPPSGVRA